MPKRKISVKADLFRQIDVRAPHACWEWTGKTGNRGRTGYGFFGYDGEAKGAHVWSYIFEYGPFKKGLFVLHNCDNSLCCNPRHLRLGTAKDNTQDSIVRGRSRLVRPGGQLSGENHPHAKLTMSQARQIRKMYASGKYKQIDLRRKFGVSQPAIVNIIHHKSYKEAK